MQVIVTKQSGSRSGAYAHQSSPSPSSTPYIPSPPSGNFSTMYSTSSLRSSQYRSGFRNVSIDGGGNAGRTYQVEGRNYPILQLN